MMTAAKDRLKDQRSGLPLDFRYVRLLEDVADKGLEPNDPRN
jgi:hypothetical protein